MQQTNNQTKLYLWHCLLLCGLKTRSIRKFEWEMRMNELIKMNELPKQRIQKYKIEGI